LGVHGPYFLIERLFPNAVFTPIMEMFLKSEIIIIMIIIIIIILILLLLLIIIIIRIIK